MYINGHKTYEDVIWDNHNLNGEEEQSVIGRDFVTTETQLILIETRLS